MTIVHICQEGGKEAAYFAEGAYELASTTEGMTRLGALVQTIFELIGKLYQIVPTAITVLDTAFSSFSDLTNFYNMAKRLRSFVVPDVGTGKYLWETAWQNITSTLCGTVANVTKLLAYLKTLKLATLGNAAEPIHIIGVVAGTAANIFDTWHTINNIVRSTNHKVKAIHLKEEWSHFSNIFSLEDITLTPPAWDNWSLHVQKKIDLYTHRRDALHRPDLTPEEIIKRDQAVKKIDQWETLNGCHDPVRIIAFCEQKTHKWDVISKNCQIDQTKSWISIAINVANLIVTALGYLLPKTNAFQIPLIAFTIATHTLDLSSLLVDKFLPALQVHEAVLPALQAGDWL